MRLMNAFGPDLRHTVVSAMPDQMGAAEAIAATWRSRPRRRAAARPAARRRGVCGRSPGISAISTWC